MQGLPRGWGRGRHFPRGDVRGPAYLVPIALLGGVNTLRVPRTHRLVGGGQYTAYLVPIALAILKARQSRRGNQGAWEGGRVVA